MNSVNWGPLDHASCPPQLMSCNYCVCETKRGHEQARQLPDHATVCIYVKCQCVHVCMMHACIDSETPKVLSVRSAVSYSHVHDASHYVVVVTCNLALINLYHLLKGHEPLTSIMIMIIILATSCTVFVVVHNAVGCISVIDVFCQHNHH